jgi:hypothetical protein
MGDLQEGCINGTDFFYEVARIYSPLGATSGNTAM